VRLTCIGLLFLALAALAPGLAAGPYLVTTAPDAPAAAPSSSSTFQPSWGFALRGGAALALGSQATDNSPGGMTGADVFYGLTQRNTLDLMGLYAELPYTSAGGGGAPLTSEGIALKLDYEVYRDDPVSAWLGVGLGYMESNSTQHVPHQPVVYPVTYDLIPQSSAGPALLGCAGVNYAFYPQWTLNVELLVMSFDASGGTSNNLLAALPNVYVKWMY
jgi:hypothetical protein